jgi:hypothetical protein
MCTVTTQQYVKWLTTNYIPILTLNAIPGSGEGGGIFTQLTAPPGGFADQADLQDILEELPPQIELSKLRVKRFPAALLYLPLISFHYLGRVYQPFRMPIRVLLFLSQIIHIKRVLVGLKHLGH